MKFILALLAITFLAALGSLPERREVIEPSEFFGRKFVTSKPLAYLTGLPRFDEVARYVRENTTTLFADEVDRRITDLTNHCANCIGKDRISTPIRLTHIPVGTTLTVTGEYLYDSNSLFSSHIHMLIVRDEIGNSAEISDFDFKFNVAENHTITDRKTESILKNIKLFKKNNVLELSFCPGSHVESFPHPLEFLRDFQMTDEVKFKPHKGLCERGYIFKFKTLQSYLTSVYYFREWGLYGKWSNNLYKAEIPKLPAAPKRWRCRSISLSEIKHPNDLSKLCGVDKTK